jgi:hypothetical protein
MAYQRDLFLGDVTNKRLKEIEKENRCKITYNSKGKIKSLFGYIKAVDKSKQREKTKEERDQAELGGQEYWSTFRR